MFRSQFTFPETDIFYLQSKEDVEKCGIELDSVGRPKGAQPVDQFDSQPFMMAENGFRRSDIAILVSAESDDLKRSIAARMQEIQSNFPDQSIPDNELADMAIPRHCQVGSQLRDWYASLEKSGIAKVANEYIEAHKPKPASEEKISFVDDNKSE